MREATITTSGNPSGAKARGHIAGSTDGLKPVPFKAKANASSMQMLLQCRCFFNANASSMQMLLQCKCFFNADASSMQMHLQSKCIFKANASSKQMHLQSKCFFKANAARATIPDD
jgi:hypothetical protein